MFLYGNVKDKNGYAISGANVEAKDAKYQTLFQTISDTQGAYSIALPSGQ